MLVNSNPELTLSQNLSEPLHKSRASSDRSDAHFAQSGEEKKQIYTLYPLHPLKAPRSYAEIQIIFGTVYGYSR